MNPTQLKTHLRLLLTQGKEQEAIAQLQEAYKDHEPTLNDLTALAYNFKKAEEEYLANLIGHPEFSISRSKFTYALLQHISKIGTSSAELSNLSEFHIARVAKTAEDRFPILTVSLINRSSELIMITHVGIIHQVTSKLLSSMAYELKPLTTWDIELPEFSTGYLEYEPENPIVMPPNSTASIQLRFLINKHQGQHKVTHAFTPIAKKVCIKMFTDQGFVAEADEIQL